MPRPIVLLADLPALIYAKGTSADQNLSKSGGAVAGSLFLQKFVAIFDYRKGVVFSSDFDCVYASNRAGA
jgi:hypothetical protein